MVIFHFIFTDRIVRSMIENCTQIYYFLLTRPNVTNKATAMATMATIAAYFESRGIFFLQFHYMGL